MQSVGDSLGWEVKRMELILGGARIRRVVHDPDERLREYRGDDGFLYLNYVPRPPPDHLVPEDLGITLLVSSRAIALEMCCQKDMIASSGLVAGL